MRNALRRKEIDMPDSETAEIVVEGGASLTSLIQSGAKINFKAMTPEQKGEFLHEFASMFSSQVRIKDMAWINLGLLWRFAVKNKVWRIAGEHVKNANDFLRELDLGIKRREIETYAQLAVLFGRTLTERNIGVPIRKLVMIAPYCKDEAESSEWLEKAISLPSAALEDEIREVKGLPTRDECDHPAGTMEIWTRCGHCGKWFEKIRDV